MTAPRATYRLQLGPDLDFAGAAALVPYLRDLGVSHLYLSPVWQARAGSTHGYDVVDPAAVSADLGGEAGLRALADTAHAAGLGLVLDVVPNHMATDPANRYWSDPGLRARFFDLDDTTDPPSYRRFFDVDELAGVRQEDPEVFAATHAKVLELVRDGVADGLRIDHPDGLADPAGYLERLRAAAVPYVWVEKILEAGEALRDWPTAGTTGYEFCVDLQALFVDPAGEAALTELWEEVSGDVRPFAAWATEAKGELARTTFAREVRRLRAVADVPGLDESLATFPVYRTYVDPAAGAGAVAPEDRAVAAALPAPIARALLLEDPAVPGGWVTRFQQTTSPVVAKGVEDTAFYRYGRLLAHNEVGGDPGRFSLSVAAFHERNAARAERFPLSMLTTTTHDTKRSADVRARIGSLASMAEEWAGAVRRWRADSAVLPAGSMTAAEELFVYQTLIGAWPIDAERLEPYLIKALREAKQGTNWITPDEAHEAAVLGFARALLAHGPFLYGWGGWAARVAEAGRRAALGQTLLKLTAPGIPDIYQGDEDWFLALVDPDNRRPVDWVARHAALAEVQSGDVVPRERAKVQLVAAALALRARLPEAFAGAYTPIPAGEEVLAFLRGEDVLVAVAVRDELGATPGWDLPPAAAGSWRDVVTGATFDLPGHASLLSVLGPDGRALLERVA